MRKGMKNMRWKRAAGVLLAGTLALTGCSTDAGSGEGSTAQTTAAEATAAESTAAESEKTAEAETEAKEDSDNREAVEFMKGANELVSSLGMADEVQKWAGTVFVVNPLDGSGYGEKDLGAFLELVNSQGPAMNVKVVGIEDGGTFVNNYVSQKCYFVSGMFVYNGEMEEGLDYLVPVPVYLTGDNQTAVEYYTKANEGEKLAVVETGTEGDQGTAFENAWDKVLSKTYRIYNWTTEFYSSNIMDHNTPYELTEIVDFDALGIKYITCKDEKVSGMDGAYTWFEYVPE